MNLVSPIYPADHAGRDRWILDRRAARNAVDPLRSYASFVEEERAPNGEIVSVATILLSNRECPWRCLMCDLWRNTLESSTPIGSITVQIGDALARLPHTQQIKLYNSGSFFDPRAIPLPDYPAIANHLRPFERVIVECHPSLVAENCFHFANIIDGQLEVAMGLETANPVTLEKLNKQMTLAQFAAAAGRLREGDIDVRVFILVKPPFTEEEEALEWACRSLDFAFDCGATAATLIPTRAGNGAMDELALSGDFAPPQLATVEAAFEYGLSLRQGRVFVDLWDSFESVACSSCRESRVARLRTMNLQQKPLPRIPCSSCGATP